MAFIYDLIFLIIALTYLPVYLLRRKFHDGFLARLGVLPKDLVFNRPIWIHAVSVGEALAVRGLMEELRKIYPAKRFVISTVTPTGNKIAKSLAKEGDFVTYLPLDISFIVGKVIKKVNPVLFILAETEIWPNLINCLYKNNIPVVTVNGRLSEHSFKGYLKIKFLIAPILKKVILFCVQSQRDKTRFERLGVSEKNICVTGNMKFDIQEKLDRHAQAIAIRERLKLHPEDKLFVAGSTHPGEEEVILEMVSNLQKEFPHLNLLIAPRHPERCQEVSQEMSKCGFRSVFLSEFTECKSCIPHPAFILDTVGELVSYYAAADIVFVGGSLIEKGGQNILEPAFLGKPVLFGPHMFNFRDITELFLNNKAGIMVNDPQELEIKVRELLIDPSRAQEMVKRSKQLILDNQGATLKNARQISEILGSA